VDIAEGGSGAAAPPVRAGGSSESDQYDRDYFQRGQAENARFWQRHGGMPRLEGASVLDIGCGHGSLCIDMALAGARRVVGLDVDQHRIHFARNNLQAHFPALQERVCFREVDLSDFPEEQFDVMVSKDTFEHLLDVPGTLYAARERLRPGGRLYVAAGPLYNSPYGDHGRTRALLPWGHLFIPERLLLARLRRSGSPANSVYELGLNKLSLGDYRRMFQQSGLRVVRFRVNESDRMISRLFSQLRKVPLLEELCSHNLYCILERGEAA
jgi:SAM-dependent methyltransferase